jgi:uncharacterized protein with LGFP repeats
MPTAAALVDRLARRLGPHRDAPAPDPSERRGFLAKAAVVGAALATNPLQFILRPGTAYANVCGDGVGCGTGWTVFCCTVNGGANTCPPGSFAAGWWKADASAFCGGSARYYIDCNRLPSQPGACSCVSCHDGNGTCDNRRYCCNVFRYGQCHLEIGGVTPVVCRVITCTPPWQWDPACSTSPRTDNRTGRHTAPCLPGPGASAITIKYQDLGMVGSPLGRQVSVEEDAPGGGRRATFEHGQIHWRADLGAFGSWGPVHQAWTGPGGGPAGGFGYPRSDTREVGPAGAWQDFERASLFWSEATGVHEVHGGILEAYVRAGGPGGGLGFPVSDEEAGPLDSRQSRFQSGVVTWRADVGAHAVFGGILERWQAAGAEALGLAWNDATPVAGRGFEQGFTGGAAVFWATATGAHEVREPLLTRYRRAGGPGGGMGFPVAPTEALGDGAQQSRFERGTVTAGPGLGVRAVFGAVHERWQAVGAAGDIGLPWTDELAVGDRRGKAQWFTRGAIFWSPQTGAFDVREPILSAYRSRGGGPAGPLGYPVGGPEQRLTGGSSQRFEHGTLTAEPNGTVTQS